MGGLLLYICGLSALVCRQVWREPRGQDAFVTWVHRTSRSQPHVAAQGSLDGRIGREQERIEGGGPVSSLRRRCPQALGTLRS
jgi:hypothetical protein